MGIQKVTKSPAKSPKKPMKAPTKTNAKANIKAKAPKAEKKSTLKVLAKKVAKVVVKEVKVAVKELKSAAESTVKAKTAKIEENKKILKDVVEKIKTAEKVKTAKDVKPQKSTSEYTSRVDTKNLTEEQLDNYKKWLKLQKQYGQDAAAEYKMTADFEIKATLKHKIHGWGVVMQRRDNYIDVLFETGMKTLICNYQG